MVIKICGFFVFVWECFFLCDSVVYLFKLYKCNEDKNFIFLKYFLNIVFWMDCVIVFINCLVCVMFV